MKEMNMETKKLKIFKNIFSNLSVFDKFECYRG